MTRFFKMRGRDDGRPPPGFVTWESQDFPDFSGSGFAGGSPPPPPPVGSFVPGSAVVQSSFDSPNLQILYEVDFRTLASQTLGDKGSTPTIDGRTWHQVDQGAGVPTHSEIINGTGLVVSNNASTGVLYRLGIKLSNLDSGFSANPRQQRYELWMSGTRSGSAASAVNGAMIGDVVGTALYMYGVGFLDATPTLDFQSFGTGFTSHGSTGASNNVFHVSMMNRFAFEGRYGNLVSGQFPGYGSLSLLGKNANRLDPVTFGNLGAGVFANSTGPLSVTYTRMRIVKIGD